MIKLNGLSENISKAINNPANIQRVILNTLSEVLDGRYDVVDPSNPLVFLLEASATVGSVGVSRNESLMRKIYPSLAQTHEDLYYHMSDIDYLDRFSSPGKAPFLIGLGYDEIVEKSIEVVGLNGVRKLTIPKDTEFKVDDTRFTLNYPIDINVMPHGALQIVYNTGEVNPLFPVESNVVDYEILNMSGLNEDGSKRLMVCLYLDVHQYAIKSYKDQLNPSTGFNKAFSFDDKFYYARVWVSQTDVSEWKEIKTTHSDQIFDPTELTAVLKVVGNVLEVHIPTLYFNTSTLGRGIRIDIYTTKGEMNVDLSGVDPDSIGTTWTDLKRIPGPYVEPIRTFSDIFTFVNGSLMGGNNGLTFEELRERVIHNALGPMIIPITPAQLDMALNKEGYNIVKEVDNITSRTYLASKDMGIPPEELGVSSAIGCSMLTLHESLDKLSTLYNVKDNGGRLTLESGMLFRLYDGILTTTTNSTIDRLTNGTSEQIAAEFLDNEFIYLPFHYVLDTNNNTFSSRAYYLDKPTIKNKEFVHSNQTLQLEASILRYGIEKVDEGFKLVLITRTGSTFQDLPEEDVYMQIAFTPYGETGRAYLNGTLAGRTDDGEYVFEFLLESDFDVNDLDKLILTNFKMFDLSYKPFAIDLNESIDMFIIVKPSIDPDLIRSSEIDNRLGIFMLPDDLYGLTHERLNLNLGTALTNLWSRSRTVAGSIEYERYPEDVHMTHLEDSGDVTIVEEPDGSLTVTAQYKKGDLILDDEGLPIIAHRKNDVVVVNGQPVVKNPRKIERQVDLFLMEGSFAYVTDLTSSRYRDGSVELVVNRIANEIKGLNDRLLENSNIWYYPNVTIGKVQALVEDSKLTTIDSEQSFRVRFYMTEAAADNFKLRESLSKTTTKVIGESLKARTVSVTAIAERIRAEVGEDVIDVKVSGLGGLDNNYDMLTVVDNTTSLTIRKRLTVLDDNSLAVVDDILEEFVRHSK